MLLLVVTNEESCVGTDGHPYLVGWAAAVCKWATGSGCDGQHRAFALSLRQHTHRPPTVHSLTGWMHIEHKTDTPYIFRYFKIPITCRSDGLILSQVGCSWTEKAAIWTRLHATSPKSGYVSKSWSWLSGSLWLSLALSFTRVYVCKIHTKLIPASTLPIAHSCIHLNSWMKETEVFKHACSTRANHGDTGWIHSPQSAGNWPSSGKLSSIMASPSRYTWSENKRLNTVNICWLNQTASVEQAQQGNIYITHVNWNINTSLIWFMFRRSKIKLNNVNRYEYRNR